MLVGVASIAFHRQRERPEAGQASHVYSKVDGAKNALHGSNRSTNSKVRITRGRKRIDRTASLEFAFATHQKSPCPRLGCEILILMDPMKRARHVAGTQELSVFAQNRYKLPKFKQSKTFGKTLRSLYSKILADFDIFNGLVKHFFRKTVIRCYTVY